MICFLLLLLSVSLVNYLEIKNSLRTVCNGPSGIGGVGNQLAHVSTAVDTHFSLARTRLVALIIALIIVHVSYNSRSRSLALGLRPAVRILHLNNICALTVRSFRNHSFSLLLVTSDFRFDACIECSFWYCFRLNINNNLTISCPAVRVITHYFTFLNYKHNSIINVLDVVNTLRLFLGIHIGTCYIRKLSSFIYLIKNGFL